MIQTESARVAVRMTCVSKMRQFEDIKLVKMFKKKADSDLCNSYKIMCELNPLHSLYMLYDYDY